MEWLPQARLCIHLLFATSKNHKGSDQPRKHCGNVVEVKQNPSICKLGTYCLKQLRKVGGFLLGSQWLGGSTGLILSRRLQSKGLSRTCSLKKELQVVQPSVLLREFLHSCLVESHAIATLNKQISLNELLLLLNFLKGKDLISSPFLLTSRISSTSNLNLSCVGPWV